MDATTLFLGLLLGSVGTGYFIYGKKQKKSLVLIDGIILSVLPYFGLGVVLTLIIGLLFMAVPFVIKS